MCFVQPLHSQEDTDDDGFSKLSSHLCRHNGAVMAASGLCWGIIRPCKHRHASWPESSLKLLLAIERIHTGIAFRIQMCVLSKCLCVCLCMRRLPRTTEQRGNVEPSGRRHPAVTDPATGVWEPVRSHRWSKRRRRLLLYLCSFVLIHQFFPPF